MRRAEGNPVACGMCGKAVIAGLMVNGKPANQAMSPVMGLDLAYIGRSDRFVVTSRIHVDKVVCKALEGVTYEELDRPHVATVRAPSVGRDDHDAANGVLHSVDGVGVDQGSDGRA